MNTENIVSEIILLGTGYRGTVINEWAYLEKSMDDYIAKYLSDDNFKQIEIFELLIDRLTFHNKREVLNAILCKKEIANGFVKTDKIGWPHGKLIEELRKINLERNYFAHYILNTFTDGINAYPEKIGFIEYRDSTNVKWYTPKKYFALLERIEDCIKGVEKLIP